MRRMDFGEPGGIHLACRLLADGKAMILPTETLYGFSAVATSQAGRRQIAAWKGIESPRSFLALLPSFAALLSYLTPGQDPRLLDFLRRLWPAPLTAVLRVQEAQPWGETVESGATAAFRVPAHPRVRALLAKLGAPVLSTSVNRTGRAVRRREAEIEAVFGSETDLWFCRDRGLEARAPGPGSTLVDCTSWPPRLLRRGLFDLDASLGTTPVG